MLKVLMVTTEAAPYAKTGGLADMVSALSSELSGSGVDVRVVMPRYYRIDRQQLEKHPAPFYVPMPYGDEWSGVYIGQLPGSEVPVYFIDHEELFGRDGIYGYTPDRGFEDNSRRFSFFCRAVFSLCTMTDWVPDIFHCHDWGAALVPYLLKRDIKDPVFSSSSSILTVHNLGYQGIFPLSDTFLVRKNLSWQEARELEFDGALNFLKTGIMTADLLTTVSPTYAKEIQTPEYGHRLETLLRQRSGELYGILNGADYDHWDPSTDPYIKPDNFSVQKTSNKRKVKKRLLGEFGLPPDTGIPVVGMVTRLAPQKGIDELCAPGSGSLYEMCSSLKADFIIVGSGEKWCEQELGKLAERLPNLKVWIGYSEYLAHLVEAGSDFFLMPSRYEPCGLNQIYSLRYGTLPIVRNTGGLADTVENYNEETGGGTGFVFNDLTPQAIYGTVKWALETWYDRKDDITKMKRRAMKKDFSWTVSAGRYMELYRKLAGSRKKQQ